MPVPASRPRLNVPPFFFAMVRSSHPARRAQPDAPSIKLAALGAVVGIGEIGDRRIEAAEQARDQNPARVIPRPLDVADLALGRIGGGRQFDLFQATIFPQRSKRQPEMAERVGRALVVGARHGGYAARRVALPLIERTK